VRGEPIVCTPAEALRCFLATEMDALIMENIVVDKREVGAGLNTAAREEYRAQFALD
jgi:carbamoyltransferase